MTGAPLPLARRVREVRLEIVQSIRFDVLGFRHDGVASDAKDHSLELHSIGSRLALCGKAYSKLELQALANPS